MAFFLSYIILIDRTNSVTQADYTLSLMPCVNGCKRAASMYRALSGDHPWYCIDCGEHYTGTQMRDAGLECLGVDAKLLTVVLGTSMGEARQDSGGTSGPVARAIDLPGATTKFQHTSQRAADAVANERRECLELANKRESSTYQPSAPTYSPTDLSHEPTSSKYYPTD
jgi:hypothetical protein